jgi:hypothetical protein
MEAINEKHGARTQAEGLVSGISERLAQFIALLITTAVVFGFAYVIQMMV